MNFGDVRAAIVVAYVALVVWRGSVGFPEGIVRYMAAYIALMQGSRLVEWWLHRTRLQRDIEVISAADPAEAGLAIDRLWSASMRAKMRAAVLAEGEVERDGNTERFPFPRSIRRRTDWAFWVTALCSVTLLLSLFASVWPRATGWGAWCAGFLLAVAAGYWRTLARVRSSTVEVTPWDIALLDRAGEREKVIRWSQSLLLQNQPKRKSVLLTTETGIPQIELHYARVGFGRLIPLVLERGGFPTDPEAEGQPDR